MLRKGFLSGKNGKCKSPEVGICLAYLRNKRLVCWSRVSEEKLARDGIIKVVKGGRGQGSRS